MIQDITVDSVSDSNFKYELPQSIHLPLGAVFFVTDVCIPNVWRTIETSVDDKIYISLGYLSSNPALAVQGVIDHWSDSVGTLPAGYYSEQDFANLFNTVLKSLDNGFNASYNLIQKTLTITLSDNYTSFRFYTDYEIQQKGVSDPQSINEIIQNIKQTSDIMLPTSSYMATRIILHPVNSVYVTSPNLGNFDTLAHFSNNVIKKVPVLSDYGTLICDQFVAPSDFLPCSGQSLKLLEFNFRDGWGKFIP